MKTNLIPLAFAASIGLFVSCAKDEAIAPASDATATALHMTKQTCSNAINAMMDDRFTLTWLNGYPVDPAAGTERPWLRMSYDRGSIIEGHTGCNQFDGHFEIDCTNLDFSGIGSSQMLCPGNAELEQDFLEALDEIDTYVFNGQELRLVRGHTILMKLTNKYRNTVSQQTE